MLSGLVSSGMTGPTRSRHNVGPLWISAKNKQPFILETVRAGTFPKNHALTVDGSVFLGSPSSGAGRLHFYQNNQYAPVSTLIGTSDINNNQNLRCGGNFMTTNLYISYSAGDVRFLVKGDGGDTFSLGSSMVIQWGNAVFESIAAFPSAPDLKLLRDAAGTLAQRNGVNAQTFRVYNTYTSATSYERGVFDWITTANTLRIGTEKGSAGGTARDLVLVTDGTTRLTIGATTGNVTLTAPITLQGYTVATLPTGVQGHKAFVTDALGPTYLVAVVAGGAVITEVFYNGTDWVCS